MNHHLRVTLKNKMLIGKRGSDRASQKGGPSFAHIWETRGADLRGYVENLTLRITIDYSLGGERVPNGSIKVNLDPF
jgi:hypothetical protein